MSKGGSKSTIEGQAAVKNGVVRMILALLALAMNILLTVLIVFKLHQNYTWFAVVFDILALITVLYIYGLHTSSSVKIPWMLIIIFLPVAGMVFYLLVGLNNTSRKMRKRYKKIDEALLPRLPENTDVEKRLQQELPFTANIAHYLRKYAGFPVYENTDITYYDDAAKGLEAQKEALRKAKGFIFMEYHAIEDSASWHGICDILEEKVKEGVEVRVFYDDMGSIGFINTDFVKRLEAKGIKARVFNPFSPGQNIFLNNRDHRKITVIDGKVGFTGGYNLADEYFHVTEPFGFWKDTGLRLEGDAVRSLTVTFLEMWNAIRDDDVDDVSFEKYLTDYDYTAKEKTYVLPYADSPMDDEAVGEEVYMSMAESATKYVWFITPYLIITEEMIHTLSIAAKRGIDVRIITPGIPDKKMVYSLTRSYYNVLVRNGVRIYEYTPGFCHAKMSITDDYMATCGTINLDFRSLYHHFENGCLYAGCQAVMDTKKDFEKMFSEANEVTEYYRSGRGSFLRFGQMLLRLVAPLM
ncbi:MAG: cardiolipin synthase [Butyrivibrio sp.]|nr:cardiolipin synthase [Butyrivibrio sp.]